MDAGEGQLEVRRPHNEVMPMPARPRSSAKRIVILGSGYVGTALGRQLAAAGHPVVGTTRAPERCAEIEAAGMEARVFTLADVDGLHALLERCDVIYLTLSAGRHHRDYRAAYVRAAHLLVAALPHTPVRHVIYTSSTGVYAQNDGSWVDEQSATAPETDRGKALVETERILLAAAGEASSVTRKRRVAVSIVRLAGIYGPGRGLGRRALRSAGQRRSDGNVWVNLIHHDDIVNALARLVYTAHPGVLNLGNDEPLRRRDLYNALLASAGAKPIEWRDDPSLGQGKRVCNQLIKRTLSLTLQHSRAVETP